MLSDWDFLRQSTRADGPLKRRGVDFRHNCDQLIGALYDPRPRLVFLESGMDLILLHCSVMCSIKLLRAL